MKLCKDCEKFHNGCSFSEIPRIYDESACYVACAQFVPQRDSQPKEEMI